MNREKAKHLTNKLLSSPIGREVLGEELGGEIMPKELPAQQEATKPVVACLVPCRDHPQPRMQEAFQKMSARSKEVCSLYLGSRMISTSVVHWSRNMVLSELIKTNGPWTHVLFIDDDIVPPDDALINLLRHKKDIIGAVCTTRQDPPKPNMKVLREDGIYEQIFSWPDGALLEVGAVGTGMILITREALNKVADAYWNCDYEREFYQIPEERAEWLKKQRLQHFEDTANAFWFRFLPDTNGAFEMGEDMSFCFVAKRYCGIPIFVDTSIQPEHIGQYGYGVKDYLPYRDAMIERAKIEGNYRDESQIKSAEPSKMNTFKLTYEAEEPVTA